MLSSSYKLNKETNVFMRDEYVSIAYNDGDETENRIFNIINNANDLSCLSAELKQHCTDWPSLYHLSSNRGNILRPVAEHLTNADILEIGAGCGAITRYIGECGANVLALEGSARRAAIARSRTRDLHNVTVVSERFDLFESDLKFDVITLIGVLEYANLFTPGSNPALSMLTRVQEMLKPNGKLIIAIENQLGLKYFAGAPEDHLGLPMYGLEGRYRSDQPQTYGRKALTNLLSQAGFEHSEFMAPFPDYKLPISIVTESGFECNAFDAAAFAIQSATRDPQSPRHSVFSPELVWKTLEQNGIAMDMANSFLIVAHNSTVTKSSRIVLAYHYSTERLAEYCKETIFILKAEGDIEVRSSLLAPQPSFSSPLVHFKITEQEQYYQGRLLSSELISIIIRDNWNIDDVGAALRRHLGIIQQNTGCPQPDSVHTLLPGECFDLVPQNIMVLDDGSVRFFDREWTLKNSMPVGWLIFRTLLLLLQSVTRIGHAATGPYSTRMMFFKAAFHAAGFDIDEKTLNSFGHMEATIQASVTPHSIDSLENWWADSPLPVYSLSQALHLRDVQLAECERVITEMNQKLSDYERMKKELDQALYERERMSMELNQALQEREADSIEFNQALRERERLITDMNEALGGCERMITDLNHKLTESIKMAAQMDQALLAKENLLGKSNELHADSTQKIAELNLHLAHLSNALLESQETIKLIQNSLSWKLTSPLRLISSLLRTPIQHARINLGKFLYKNPRLAYLYARAKNGFKRYGFIKGVPAALRTSASLARAWATKKIKNRTYKRRLNELRQIIIGSKNFVDIFHVPMGWSTPLFQRFQHMSLQAVELGGLALYGGHTQVDKDMFVYKRAEGNVIVFDALDHQVIDCVFQALAESKKPVILRLQSIDLATRVEEIEKFLALGLKVVYEYIDEINEEITGSIPKFVIERHSWLLGNPKILVIATSDKLYEQVLQHRRENCLLSTNGVDLNHWSKTPKTPPADMKPALASGLPIIGYHGALAKWIDYDLLRKIAESGQYELLLIGYEHDNDMRESGILDIPRVHFLGSKSYFNLNDYTQFYSVGILPFKRYALTESVSPVKLFEYMAASRPVVTTDLLECFKYKSCLVSDSHGAFLKNLETAITLRNDKKYMANLRNEAVSNSWHQKAKAMYLKLGVVQD